MDMDAVTEILNEAVRTEVLPRFQSLTADEVSEKNPGDLVTVADKRSEELITRLLRDIEDVPVVGEEATAADPGLVAALNEAPAAWLVDPVDGTSNFVAGSKRFAVMAAFVRGGETVASWIVQPLLGHTYVAEKGSGAFRDGKRLLREPASPDPARLRGDALTRFLSPDVKAHVEAAIPRFAEVGQATKCAGVDYPRLATGERDFILFHRILPWDHAPGSLLLTEAGGYVRRPDGTEYRPGDGGFGLLSAADETTWKTARELLLP
ncbi:inositol monophosphatase family protein [Stackebrandtia nassauensis]|uniref:Inositol monophosphatase n=1 Tax=Stackebrandtia nassauensis (strain DSM 44728 / CIP 108903 / NRRL B-16338 / NBRC 102104 / LLR-40K-21) TaxID=446470 RepID=D3PU94_STANL|nr:inositol monophosphatase family protein [Stackebrandtia nassauensis]ADD41040.1 inositol monophosphatase [Stackebrandtia nassauensis DSM 44728]